MAKKTNERKGLGRGLSALMSDVSLDQSEETKSETSVPNTERKVPIEQIVANADQPRRLFDEGDLQELTASIREKGVLQPLIVRTHPKDPKKYQIVAGERRWRAAQQAQLHELPIILREFSDEEVLEVAIIENVQRANLNPVEEASGYRQLMVRHNHTQNEIATALGKSRSHIANMLRLLQLPRDVLELLRSGDISMGHARALITTDHPSELAKRIVAEGLSVRDIERLAQKPKKTPATKSGPAKNADTTALERDLSAATGYKIAINHDESAEKGSVTIKYKDLDQLDSICQLLSRP